MLAWVYVLDGYEGGLPSARYLGLIADAAQAAGAPDEYVAELRAAPVPLARRVAQAATGCEGASCASATV